MDIMHILVQDRAKSKLEGKRFWEKRVARNKKEKMRYIFGEIDDWHDRRCLDECRYFVL